MRRLAGFLVLVLLAPVVLALPNDPQDDAGSGGDAPDAREGAVLIPLGVEVSGKLRPVAGASYFLGLPDLRDWYSVEIPAQSRVFIALSARPAEGATFASTPLWRLVDAQGRMTAWGFGTDEWPVVVEEAGRWDLEVYVFDDQPWDYTLRVRVEAATAAAAAFAGGGWVVVRVDLEEGAVASGGITTWIEQYQHSPGMACDASLAKMWASYGCGAIVSLAPNPAVQTSALRLTRTAPLPGGAAMASWLSTGAVGPATVHFVAFGLADEVAGSIDLEVRGAATVDVRRGGADDVFGFRRGDLDGTGVAAGGTGAGSSLAASRAIEDSLLAHVDCRRIAGTCTVTDPEGTTTSPTIGMQRGGPGTWTFARSDVTVRDTDGFVVFGADLVLT